MRSLWTPPERLIVSRRSWRELLTELARRGRGESEAGAFLLAADGERLVSGVVYFDDLDPGCLRGSIALGGEAFSRLAGHCHRSGRRVIGDVHTHPFSSVAQSETDRAYPMVATAGHVALIVPFLAQRPIRRTQLGFHRYDGDAGWDSFFDRAARRRLKLR